MRTPPFRARRNHRLLALALAGTVAGALALSADGPTRHASATSPVLLGAADRPDQPGETYPEALVQMERISGRAFTLHRTYLPWTSTPVTPTIRWDLATHHLPVVSVVARRNSGPVSWARIAAGAEDATIVAQANAFKALNAPIVVGFNHEPENDNNGTPAQFVAAFRHYVEVFRAQHATNVQFAWIMMANSFNRSAAEATSFYPGDAYIDWIAADGYNWGVCRNYPWRSFAQAFAGFRAFGAAHPGKRLMIAEVGSEEDPANPARKAQWFTDAATTIAGWPQLRAVSYFNTNMGSQGGQPNCHWLVTTSATTQAGWRRFALNPVFQAAR